MSCCGLGRVVCRSMAVVGVGMAIAAGHMWIVQGGESPVRLTSELFATSTRAPTGEPTERRRTPSSEARPHAVPADGEAIEPDAFDPGAFDPDALGLEISTEEAFALWEQDLAMFVDTRRHREYEEGHIPGALWIPAELFSRGRTPEAVGFLDPSQPLVLYCGGGDCDASKNTALLLTNYGFTRLHIYTDGLPAWIQAGHDVEAGPDPITGGRP